MDSDLKEKVADKILPLFDHTDKSPYLNVYDKEKLIREIGSVQSKEELAMEIQEEIGESFDIDPSAFEEERILRLSAPIDRENESQNKQKVREKIQQISELVELKPPQQIREPEEPEETIQYKFILLHLE